MALKLLDNSEFYREKNDLYEVFSEAEDSPGKIVEFLKSFFKDKVVLDVGIGNGRFARYLAPVSKKYLGVDISKEQLEKAKKNLKGMENVELINQSAEKIPLESESVDIIFGSWSFDTIKNIDKRNKVLNEVERVLKKEGKIYLVENYPDGEFEKLVDYRPDYLEHREEFFNWLDKNGFKRIEVIDTYFKFDSFETAKEVFKGIWGEELASKVKSEIIEQKVSVLEKTKN
jgi:ubiquinone/menaquinone biosynthesis C-methylase UbiE